MPYTLQVLDSAGAVVFDLHNQTQPFKTSIQGVEMGAPSGSPSLFEPLNMAGGFRTHSRDELVTSEFGILCEADTVDALFAGINDLTEALRKHEVVKFVRDGSTTVRFIDYVHASVTNLGLVDDYNLAVQNKAAAVLVSLVRQPYLRGELVTVGPVTVNNDPAAVNGRVLSITNSGDAPAPLTTLSVQNSTGPFAQFLALLRPRADGFSTATYVSTSHFVQCEDAANRTDTTTVADATASGGNVKRTTFATNTTLVSRIQIGLLNRAPAAQWQGPWDVYLRAKVTASPVTVQMRWGIQGPTAVEAGVSVSSTSYADYYLGRVVGFAGQAPVVDVFASLPSGSGNLDSDVLSFVPTDQQASVAVADPLNQRGVSVAADGSVFVTGSGGAVPLVTASVAGSLPPKLDPGVNVLYLHGPSALTSSATVNYSYYPRYFA